MANICCVEDENNKILDVRGAFILSVMCGSIRIGGHSGKAPTYRQTHIIFLFVYVIYKYLLSCELYCTVLNTDDCHCFPSVISCRFVLFCFLFCLVSLCYSYLMKPKNSLYYIYKKLFMIIFFCYTSIHMFYDFYHH